MIGVDEILDALQITVHTGAVKREKPLSVALMASIGSGKTSMVKKTASKTEIVTQTLPAKGNEKPKLVQVRKINGSVLYATSCTPYALHTRYGEELKKGHIKHIVIPDFLSIWNLPKYQMMGVIFFYNSLVEEGIMSIESRDSRFLCEIPVTCGLITTIAKGDFAKRQGDVAATGFLSRLLPFSFRYKDSTSKQIREAAKLREYLIDSTNFGIKLPPEREIDLPLEPADIIEEVAMRTKDKEDDVGVRRQKQLGVFCMGNALMNGRDTVNSEDTNKLLRYEKYINWDCSAEL